MLVAYFLSSCINYVQYIIFIQFNMDFARKQLEKYGWKDGKGLGKNENGISQALKPKLKRSVAGIGYDAAADFTENWWSALYDKAAKNVEVAEKGGKTKKIKTKESEFEITNSMWRIKKKKRKDGHEEKEYSDFFVKTAELSGDKVKIKKVKEESDEEEDTGNVFKLTDEELFAACEGRTAHKGARHGLKALGKLARIEQQERLLLMESRYKGYSHAKKTQQDIDTQVFENINLDSDTNVGNSKKSKKKKKKCSSSDKMNVCEENSKVLDGIKDKQKSKDAKCLDSCEDSEHSQNIDNKKSKKRKKDKINVSSSNSDLPSNVIPTNDPSVPCLKKRKKKLNQSINQYNL